MARSTTTKTLRLTPDELAALRLQAEGRGLSVNALLVKCVREIVGATPDLLNEDADALHGANAQAQAIGRNLNQLVRAINTGRAAGVTVDRQYLDAVAERVEAMRREIQAIAERQKNRWVDLRTSNDQS